MIEPSPERPKSLSDFLRDRPAPARIKARRRYWQIVSDAHARLIARRGKEGALIRCQERVAFCARAARGLRWTIWTQIIGKLTYEPRIVGKADLRRRG